MSPSDRDTLVCTLRLLFDGKSNEELAAAVWEVVKDKEHPWEFLWVLDRTLKQWSVYTVDPSWVEEQIADEAEYNELGWFVGTDKDIETLADSLRDAIRDCTYDAIREDLLSAMRAIISENPSWVITYDDVEQAAAEAGVELNL